MRVLIIWFITVIPVSTFLVWAIQHNTGILQLTIAYVVAFLNGRLAAEIAIDIDSYLRNKQ